LRRRKLGLQSSVGRRFSHASAFRAKGKWEYRLMFNGILVSVIFVCPKCGVAYVATQERHRDEVAGRFVCTGCGAVVHAWSGVHDYPTWKPLRLPFD
jgi:hypothetical protein